MTKRDRVIAAVKHLETDIVPYNIQFTEQEQSRVAAFLNDPAFGEKLGNHIDFMCFNGFRKQQPPGSGYYIDDFGIGFDYRDADKDIIDIDGGVITEPRMSAYSFPQLKEELLRSDIYRMIERAKDKCRLVEISFSLFERAWLLRGMENLLMDMLEEPGFTIELLEAITDFNLKLIDISLEYDIDGVFFGDDWGQQKGMIMGPSLWRKFIKPHMAQMIARVKRKGKFTCLHSCGDILEIFPDLIEIGLDVYQTFQPEIYDIKKVKNEYGNDLVFWGGISSQGLLPFGTPEQIRDEVHRTIGIMGKKGGFIASPTHTITADVPPENVMALAEVLMNQKGYSYGKKV